MRSLHSSFFATAAFSLALCALPYGCGQTTGPSDTGPDATDAVTADRGNEGPDVSTTDVSATDVPATDVIDASPALDAAGDVVDATSADVFDAATIDAGADVRADAIFPDVTIPDGSTACNTTVADAPFVTITAGTGTAPTPAGGTIVLGHYQLTSFVVYGGAAPPITVSESIDLTATTLNVIGVAMGMPEQRVSLSYTASGTTFTTTPVCPTGGSPGSSGYTADATHFIVMSTSSSGTTVGTFTLH